MIEEERLIEARKKRQAISNELSTLSEIDASNRDALIEYVHNIIDKHPLSYFSLLKGRRFSKVWSDICKATSFLDEYFQPNAATRIYYYISKLDHIHTCETCGKPYVKQIKANNPNLEYIHCNTFCAQRNPRVSSQIKATKVEHGTTTKDLLERTKQRNREKYGVDWYYQSKEFEQKKLETWKSHGYDHPMHSATIKDGMKERLKEKYGPNVTCNFQIPEVKERINDHFRETLGVDWPMQSKDIRDKIHANGAKTTRKNFYDTVLLNIQEYTILTSKNEYIEMERVAPEGFITPRIPLKWKCNKCGEVFNQFLYQYGSIPRCLKCNPLLYNRIDSQEEIDLFNFLVEIDGSKYECLRHSYWNWNLLDNGKLLDIVCIDKESKEPKIAVEFNGIYWHSISNKDPGYHLMKTMKCEEIGIKLIHVWEDQWINDKDRVKAFLHKVMRDEYAIDTSKDLIELDRSQLCKLWVPEGYVVVEETEPELHEHRTKDTKRYALEDCGKLICKRG